MDRDDLESDLDPLKGRILAIETCLKHLEHASQCTDENCIDPSCAKMSRIILHTNDCSRKAFGDCPICSQVFGVCYYHAMKCKESECKMPLCSKLKKTIELRADARNSGNEAAASSEQASTSSTHTATLQPNCEQNMQQQVEGAVGGITGANMDGDCEGVREE